MKYIKKIVILAWIIHIITASGLVVGFYSIINILKENYSNLLKLIFIGFIIDGIDGTLARKFKIKEIIPKIDGALLDNIVDYLNYTFVPAIFFYYSNFIEDLYKTPICIGIIFASIYQFSRTDAKTKDNYFRGFPSVWNFFVLSNLIFNMKSFLNIILISIGIVFSFLPVKFIYPAKTKELKKITIPFSILTLLTTTISIFFNTSSYYLKFAKIIVISYWSYLIIMSIYLTCKTRNT